MGTSSSLQRGGVVPSCVVLFFLVIMLSLVCASSQLSAKEDSLASTTAANLPSSLDNRCRAYTDCESCMDIFEYYQKRGEAVNELTENFCEKDPLQATPRFQQCTPDPDRCHRVWAIMTQDYEERGHMNDFIRNGCDGLIPCPPMEACSLMYKRNGHSLCGVDNKQSPVYVNEFFSLKSYGYPDHYVLFATEEEGILLMKEDINTTALRKAGTFRFLPGLLDNTYSYTSIESALRPNYFVSHNHGQIVLKTKPAVVVQNDAADIGFDTAATWRFVQGLSNKHWSSIESVDLFGHFIRIRNFTLTLERENDERHARETTFRIVDALYDPFFEESTRGRDWEARNRYPEAPILPVGTVPQNQPGRLADSRTHPITVQPVAHDPKNHFDHSPASPTVAARANTTTTPATTITPTAPTASTTTTSTTTTPVDGDSVAVSLRKLSEQVASLASKIDALSRTDQRLENMILHPNSGVAAAATSTLLPTSSSSASSSSPSPSALSAPSLFSVRSTAASLTGPGRGSQLRQQQHHHHSHHIGDGRADPSSSLSSRPAPGAGGSFNASSTPDGDHNNNNNNNNHNRPILDMSAPAVRLPVHVSKRVLEQAASAARREPPPVVTPLPPQFEDVSTSSSSHSKA